MSGLANDEQHYFRLILKTLHARLGVDFSLYREGTIRRRMTRRMAATHSADYHAYFTILEKSPEECERLARDFAIRVSRFFRNQPLFDSLSEEVFPALLREKEKQGDNTLRIWCAGCACGEEVYSVTITLAECLSRMGRSLDEYSVSIFGTDIDDEALHRAMRGEYSAEPFSEARQPIIDTYFELAEQPGANSSEYRTGKMPVRRVIDSIRNLAHFCKHDLASETKKSPPAGIVSNYDLILCRNVLIYFSKGLQIKAFSNLVSSLNPGGYLILGKAESIPDALESVLIPHNSSKKIYKKAVKSPWEAVRE
jgi:chemotaxis methyl-accepting protein methylase